MQGMAQLFRMTRRTARKEPIVEYLGQRPKPKALPIRTMICHARRLVSKGSLWEREAASGQQDAKPKS